MDKRLLLANRLIISGLFGFVAGCNNSANAPAPSNTQASSRDGTQQDAAATALPSPRPTSTLTTVKTPTTASAPAPSADTPAAVSKNRCSPIFQVLASSNPWLAGVPNGTKLDYNDPTSAPAPDPKAYIDSAPEQNPVVVNAASAPCLIPGKTIGFDVTGGRSTNQSGYTYSAFDGNGDATKLQQHALGSIYGKSDITAPINSLVAVFLTDADPSQAPTPAPLVFDTPAARDYTLLAPMLGQTFFIGTGVTSTGAIRAIRVPDGATRLYFGVMDAYQWNNNAGAVSVDVKSVP